MSLPVIGVIGLGLMGAGLAKRLIAGGYRVVGYDIRAEAMAAARSIGVEALASPADVARAADLVLTSLTTTAALTDVVEGPNGIVAAGPAAGKILVDHSTSEIPETVRLAALVRDRCEMGFVDAPVSGGPAAAESGTLAIMAGGADADVARARPVLSELGSVTHMGPVGAGQATKLVNQALVLTNYCVIAEALRLAEAYGIDAAKVPEALARGHAGSNLLPVLFPRMIARDFTPRGYARQVLKDL